jgi:sialate O-acetylesterase
LVKTGAGLWEAQLPVRGGGPYTIELRLTAGGAERGFLRFEEVLVGDLWVLAGQSNMVGRAQLAPRQETHPLVKVLAPDGEWRTARDPLHEHRHYRPGEKHGAGLGLAFAKEMVRRTGVPVGLIPVAVGGTSLEQWNPDHKAQGRQSLYGNMLSRFQVAGGRVTGMLWYQGEADTRTKELGPTYGERFARFVASARADFGQPELPVYFAQLARYGAEPGEGYKAWDEVQEAQRLAESQIAHSGAVATVDLDLGDPIHLDRPSLERLGLRFARRVLDGPGPRLESAAWLSRSKLRIQLSGVRGTLDAGPRATGFSLSAADGSPRLLLFRATADRSAIVFDVAESREDEPLFLWYGRGLDPPAFVRDSHDNALPAFGPVALPPRPH